MTGVRYLGSLTEVAPVVKYFKGGGTFAAGDFVKINGTSGDIVVATAGASILGIALTAGTSSSTNVPVNVTPNMIVLMDNDNDSATFAAGHIGQYADFIGGTGAMQVDTSSLSATKAQLFCLAYNPAGYGADSDTSIGKFLVTETLTAAQASA